MATTSTARSTDQEETVLDRLLDEWHTGGLTPTKFSRMLRLAKRAARRYGLTSDDVLDGSYCA